MIMDDGSLHNVPFVLLPLEQARRTPSTPSSTPLPGVVVEEVVASLPTQWSSRDFPAEVGLRVLCCSHYHVHVLKIVFQAAKRPSKLEVLAAYHTEHAMPCQGDELTRYFAASFHPICTPIWWPPETALSWPLPPTQVTLIVPHDASRRCEFIRLLVHRAHLHPDNTPEEVTIKSIDLLGELRIPDKQQELAASSSMQSLPEVPNAEGNVDEVSDLRQFLIAAGLPSAMVENLLASPPSGNRPERSESPASINVPEPAQLIIEDSKRNILDSVFDEAVRGFLARRNKQDEFLASLDPSFLHQSPIPPSLALARVMVDDRHRALAIATYTFGAFYTQCLQQALGASNEDTSDDDLVVQCLQVAEQLVVVLPRGGLAQELVFEGLLSLVRLTLTSRCSLSTFCQTLHLVRSIFLENARFNFLKLHPVMIQTGLECTVDLVLSVKHCWITPLGNKHSPTGKLTINRQLLATARHLLAQSATRSLFLHAVIPNCQQVAYQEQEHRDVDPKEMNRLRLMRWILQREKDALGVDIVEKMRSYCETLAHGDGNKLSDLAGQCLMMLDISIHEETTQLQIVRQRLEDKQRGQAKNQVSTHTSLYESYPLGDQLIETLVSRTRQYFQLHERPTALYQHVFTIADTAYANNTDTNGFRKGNIVFKGQLEVRKTPTIVRRSIGRQTEPFTSAKPPIHPDPGPIELESSFARFRGTIETRDLNAKPVARGSFDQVTKADQPQSRRPSLTKSTRVVPVDLVAVSSVDAQQVESQRSNEIVVAVPQRAVSASPSVPIPQPGGTSQEPPASPTSAAPLARKAPTPRTAPPTKGRGSTLVSSSQDGGCVVQ